MLQMEPGTMRELARQVTEVLIQRSVRLRDERVWEGDFKDALSHQLDEDPPETGRPAREVIERAVQDVLRNTLNRKVLARLFWGERAFLSSTMVNKRFVLRLCIVNHNTTWDDVRETLEAVERLAMELSG